MRRDQRGIAHVLVILLVVVVIAVAGGVGYMVMKKDKKAVTSSVETALSKAEVKKLNEDCNKQYDDEDLCKFLSSWSDMKNYQSTSTTTTSGETSQYSFEIEGSDNTHLVSSQNGTETYNVITLGNTTYTKDLSDGKWWKQTVAPAKAEENTKAFEFNTSDDISTTDAKDTTTYKAVGREACGNLSCFKYQILEKDSTDTQFVWFDTKDYLLRRWLTQGSDGSSDSSFSYDKKSISAPSPTKDAGPDQVILPGGGVYVAPKISAPVEDIPAE